MGQAKLIVGRKAPAKKLHFTFIMRFLQNPCLVLLVYFITPNFKKAIQYLAEYIRCKMQEI